MLGSEMKAVSVHYRPLPLDSRVDFIYNSSPPPFWKMHLPRGVYTDKYGILMKAYLISIFNYQYKILYSECKTNESTDQLSWVPPFVQEKC